MSSRQPSLDDHALPLYAFDDPKRGDRVLHKIHNQSVLVMLDISAKVPDHMKTVTDAKAVQLSLSADLHAEVRSFRSASSIPSR